MINEYKLRKVLRTLKGETVHLEYKDKEGPKILDDAKIVNIYGNSIAIRRFVPIQMQDIIGSSVIDVGITIDQITVLKVYCKE